MASTYDNLLGEFVEEVSSDKPTQPTRVDLAIARRNAEMAELRARFFHVDPFGLGVQDIDREARPRRYVDKWGSEIIEIPMNHPCCRVLNHDEQYSIFDVYRVTGASAAKWIHAATAGTARTWLAARAHRLGIPIWQALADLGAPIEVAHAARKWTKETHTFAQCAEEEAVG